MILNFIVRVRMYKKRDSENPPLKCKHAGLIFPSRHKIEFGFFHFWFDGVRPFSFMVLQIPVTCYDN